MDDKTLETLGKITTKLLADKKAKGTITAEYKTKEKNKGTNSI